MPMARGGIDNTRDGLSTGNHPAQIIRGNGKPFIFPDWIRTSNAQMELWDLLPLLPRAYKYNT